MPVQQVFKKYEVITANSAEQMGLSVTAMLSLGMGWQVSSPLMCVAKPDGGLHYFVGMMLFEYVQTPDVEAEPPTEQ